MSKTCKNIDLERALRCVQIKTSINRIHKTNLLKHDEGKLQLRESKRAIELSLRAGSVDLDE